MVLIWIIASLCFQSNVLLNKYEKAADTELKKNLSIKDYKLNPLNFKGDELYVITSKNEKIGYLLLSEVAACNIGGCPSYKAVEKNASSEYFDMLTILDPDGQIISIKILDYFSDYGYEITSKKYLRKFYGHKVCAISKNEDGVDAISGATISSFALEAKLGQLCDYF